MLNNIPDTVYHNKLTKAKLKKLAIKRGKSGLPASGSGVIRDLIMAAPLVLALFFVPALTFASTNSVSIQPIVPVCGPQTIPVVVNATYWNLDGRIVTYLNGHELNHYNHKPTSITENITVAPGTYQFKARTYAIEWANHFYSG